MMEARLAGMKRVTDQSLVTPHARIAGPEGPPCLQTVNCPSARIQHGVTGEAASV